jgi:hypothetical protein
MLLSRVAGLLWNHRPDSTGMGGWLGMESVADLEWNGWPVWTGIRTVPLLGKIICYSSLVEIANRGSSFSLISERIREADCKAFQV